VVRFRNVGLRLAVFLSSVRIGYVCFGLAGFGYVGYVWLRFVTFG
jgi:hypothetical protein